MNIVDMEFKDAGPLGDEFCQVASKSHHLFKNYDKSAHQSQECHETTQINVLLHVQIRCPWSDVFQAICIGGMEIMFLTNYHAGSNN